MGDLPPSHGQIALFQLISTAAASVSRDRPPNTVQVASAVKTVRQTGRAASARSAIAAPIVTMPTSTPTCSTPAGLVVAVGRSLESGRTAAESGNGMPAPVDRRRSGLRR